MGKSFGTGPFPFWQVDMPIFFNCLPVYFQKYETMFHLAESLQQFSDKWHCKQARKTIKWEVIAVCQFESARIFRMAKLISENS